MRTEGRNKRHLTERVRGKKVLVILDSDHRERHVYQELKAYGPMINKGSYLIVQDTNVKRASGSAGLWCRSDGPELGC